MINRPARGLHKWSMYLFSTMSQFLNLNYTIVYKKILYPQRIHIINVIFYENAPIEY